MLAYKKRVLLAALNDFNGMRQEFQSTGIPAQTIQKEEINKGNHTYRAFISSEYQSDLEDKEIINFYESRLISSGWKKVENKDSRVSFCKSDIQATLGIQSKNYFFGMVIDHSPFRKFSCL